MPVNFCTIALDLDLRFVCVCFGVILDLEDLKWLVEQQQQPPQAVSETGREAVVEMKKLVARFAGGEESNKLWLIGTATCETYLRCQVYHSSMENDWDLQVVPIASRSPLPGLFPRLGTERLLSNPLESMNPLKTLNTPLPTLLSHLSENLGAAQRPSLCPRCSENYDKELSKLAAIEKLFSEAKLNAQPQPSLPAWLQNAKLNTADAKMKDGLHGVLSKQKTQELQKKWRDTCLNLHPSFHQSARTGPPAMSMASLYNPNLLSRPPFQPKLQTMKPLGAALQLNTNQASIQPLELVKSSPRSPVRTDLSLGWKEPEAVPSEDQAKDLLGCISSEPQTKLLDKFSNALDAS